MSFKALSLVPCFSSRTQPLSVLLSPPFLEPPPLYRWQSTVLLLANQLRLKHYSRTKCSSKDLSLDHCKLLNSQLIKDWIPARRTQKVTRQNAQLLIQHSLLCPQPRLHLWWTPHLFRQISSLAKSRIIIFDRFVVSAHTSISQQPVPCCRPIVHCKRNYCNSD